MPTPAQIRAEIDADPAGLGYAPLVAAGNHEGIARLMRQRRDDVTIEVATVDAAELVSTVDPADYAAITPASYRTMWSDLIAAAGSVGVKIGKARVRAQLDAIFPPGAANNKGTRDRIAALQTRKGTRAEALWGEGTEIRGEDVTEALK